MIRRISPILLASLALAAPAHADTPIAPAFAPTTVAAAGDRVAWSAYDPASGQWQLMTRANGITAPAGVLPYSAPFDVDLGVLRNGHVIAIYSRCTRPAAARGPVVPLPKGCDLYTHDFTDATANRHSGETKLRSASRAGTSEFLPTVDGDRIAFVRVFERRRGAAAKRPWLYTQRLDGRALRRLTSGPRGATGGPGPIGLDMNGRRIAVVWEYVSDDETHYTLRSYVVGGSTRVLDRTSVGGVSGATLVGPTVEQSQILYASIGVGESAPDVRLRRSTFAGERTESKTSLALLSGVTSGSAGIFYAGRGPLPPQDEIEGCQQVDRPAADQVVITARCSISLVAPAPVFGPLSG